MIVEGNRNPLLGGGVAVTRPSLYKWLGDLRPGGAPVPTFGESSGSGVATGCLPSAALRTGAKSRSFMSPIADGRIAVVGATVLGRALPGLHAGVPWTIVLDAGGRPWGKSQAGVARFGYDRVFTDDPERVPHGRL